MKKNYIKKIFEKIIFEPLQGILAIILYFSFWCLNPKLSSWIGGKLALLISPFLPQNKRAFDNIKLIYPNMTNLEQRKILNQAIENLEEERW